MEPRDLLINSSYSKDAGKELLLNLINQKIDFLNKELFLNFLHSDVKDRKKERRVAELKELKQRILDDFEHSNGDSVDLEASFSYSFFTDKKKKRSSLYYEI